MATKININNVEILVPTKQDITTQVNEIIDETIIETHVETTYAGLVTLRNNSELIPNTMYRITDYETTTAEPDTISAGHVFDVIVLATSVNTLSKDAWARKSVRDVENYFNEQDISLWKLEYDLDNYDTKFSWADTINGKGVIYRMIDELNNDLPYDFKNIKKYLSQSDFLELGGSIVNKNTDNYYYTFNTSKDTEGTTHGSSNTDIVNNFVKSYKHKEIYFLSVNLFINIGHVRNNNFFGESYDNVFVNSTVENNNITATFNTNRVKGLFTNNTINAAFQANKNISNFQYNIIDANFTKNDNVGRNFNYNHIVAGEAFNQNVLVGRNIIKNVFSSVSRTTINNSVQNNTLTNLYYANVPEYTENVVASNLRGSSSSQFYLDFVGTDLDEFTDQGFPRTYNKINTEYYLTFVKDGILKSYKKDNFDDMSWTDITQSGGGIEDANNDLLNKLYYNILYLKGYHMPPIEDWEINGYNAIYNGTQQKIIIPYDLSGKDITLGSDNVVTHVAEPIGFLDGARLKYLMQGIKETTLDLTEVNGDSIESITGAITFPYTDTVTNNYVIKLPKNLNNLKVYSNVSPTSKIQIVFSVNQVLPKLHNAANMFKDYTVELGQPSTFNIPHMPSLSNTTRMFYRAKITSPFTQIELGKINVAQVKDFSVMFDSADFLGQLRVLKTFNTSNATNMGGMFSTFKNDLLDNLKNFDTRKVENFKWMFAQYTASTELDISSFDFDTSDLYAVEYMFAWSSLETVYVKTQEYADYLAQASGNPEGIKFVVRPSEKSAVIEALDWNN